MKRASYREGVSWIAGNDEPSDLDVRNVAGLISVCLLADLFAKTTFDVALDVVNARVKSINETREAKNKVKPIIVGSHVFTEDDIPF